MIESAQRWMPKTTQARADRMSAAHRRRGASRVGSASKGTAVLPTQKNQAKMSAQEAAARRGRKRGKHNFEPGYKELLFKEWASFTDKHQRCPKLEEIEKFSCASFERRKKELAEEDPDHPLLVVLDAPLDATQVKNLINNEKKKRHRTQPQAPQQGAFPFAALQGLPLEDAARVMKGWLETTGLQQQQQLTEQSHETPAASPAPSTSNANRPKDLISRRMSFVSETVSDGMARLDIPITPQSKPRVVRRPDRVGRTLNFSADSNSDDDSGETHSVERKGALTSPCSTANISSITEANTAEAEDPHTSSKLDMSKIVQSTAAEAISLSLLHQSHKEATLQNTPAQLLPSILPAQLGVQPLAPVSTLAESIASVAANACNKALAGMLGGTIPMNLFHIQEIVKEVVDEQVRMLANEQRAQILQQQQQQQQQAAATPSVAQFWQVMQMMQGLQNRQ